MEISLFFCLISYFFMRLILETEISKDQSKANLNVMIINMNEKASSSGSAEFQNCLKE